MDDIAVANMSLTAGGGVDDGNCGRTNQDVLHLAICRVADAGVVSVAATGNSGVDFSTNWAPAIYDEVLAVTAIVDFDGRPGGLGTVPSEFPKYSCGEEDDDSAAFFSNYTTEAAEAAHTIAAPRSLYLLDVERRSLLAALRNEHGNTPRRGCRRALHRLRPLRAAHGTTGRRQDRE